MNIFFLIIQIVKSDYFINKYVIDAEYLSMKLQILIDKKKDSLSILRSEICLISFEF